MVSRSGDLILGFSKSSLGKRGAARVRWRFGSCARRAIVVGHTQATSHLIRCRSIGQGMSHRSGHDPSYPIHIEWGKGEGFLPQSLALPQLLCLLLK